MITIAQRAALFRCAAKASESKRLQLMYSETADVLEAQAAAYNDLYAAANCAIQEGVLTALRIHIRMVEDRKKHMQERSGTA